MKRSFKTLSTTWIKTSVWTTLGILTLSLFSSGCIFSSDVYLAAVSNATATPTPTSTVSSLPTTASAKAVKILFLQETQTGQTQGGSFDPPSSSNGTPVGLGNGQQAIRIYNPDNTLLASGGPGSSGWPAWLSKFEIGISGSANSKAPDKRCAVFSQNNQAGDRENDPAEKHCNFGGGTAANCGAPTGQFRVSEADCQNTLSGTGANSDGVYIRAVFDRDSTALGTSENILAVLEYAASALSPAPTDPTQCLSGSTLNSEACSEYTWRAYLKHSSLENTQPFLLLIPPTFASVFSINPATHASPQPLTAGSGVAAKQFILPLAIDTGLTVFQISRTGGLSGKNAAFTQAVMTYCNVNNLSYSPSGAGGYSSSTLGTQSFIYDSSHPGDSPLCSGVVFYSLTLYRI